MRLYLDIANAKEIREAAGFGVLDGVTTNSSFVTNECHNVRDTTVGACHLVKGIARIQGDS